MKKTQCERVLDYIEEFGSINSAQAIVDLGCMRLASRVSDLKRLGYPIDKKMATGKNRYGETTHYAEYFMRNEETL